jgi:hypothetical protein
VRRALQVLTADDVKAHCRAVRELGWWACCDRTMDSPHLHVSLGPSAALLQHLSNLLRSLTLLQPHVHSTRTMPSLCMMRLPRCLPTTWAPGRLAARALQGGPRTRGPQDTHIQPRRTIGLAMYQVVTGVIYQRAELQATNTPSAGADVLPT